jgi:hypothetical protein
MTLEFLALIGIGFLAQLVDGALGMAFGLISTIDCSREWFPTGCGPHFCSIPNLRPLPASSSVTPRLPPLG